MKNYYLTLIRHAATQSNLDGTYCGAQIDEPVCDEGESALYDLLDNGVYPYVERVYTSPMLRAVQTSNILYPEHELIRVPGLAEANLGRFEGKSIYELRDDEDYQKWIVPNSSFTPEGVEPPKKFLERCYLSIISIIDELMRSGVHSAAVVTHASVIGSIMSALCLPHLPAYEWACDAGHGFKLATNTALWQRDGICEAVCEVPEAFGRENDYE